MEERRGFTTRAVHGSRQVEPVVEEPAATPIYQAATFIFSDIETFAAVGKSKISGGYLYTRWANPTVDALARTVADLEGAEATACFGSGMGAISGALAPFLRAGDHVVASTHLYGGTHSVLDHLLPRAGIDATRVDVTDQAAVEKAFTDRTRILYAETIGNPALIVADIARLAEIAHARGALLVVDSTFTPPCMFRPFEHGADVVMHSATKYLGGHSDVTAGVLSGSAETIARIRHDAIDTGAVLAPFEAWLVIRGIQTLALRMERISSNALVLARALERHPAVECVIYPGLASHAQHDLAARLFEGGFGGMLAFEVGGGAPAGRRFLERVRLACPAASLGGTKTLVVHPVSVTHTQLSPEQLGAAGITPGMIRVSVGIEDARDLVADFSEALS